MSGAIGALLRQLVTATLLLVAGLGLGGCASTAQPGPAQQSDAQRQELAEQGRRDTVSCLQERGWDVQLEADGWSLDGLAAEQQEAFERDQAECQDLSGLNDIQVPPLTEERLAEIYDYEVQLAECLQEQGYDIPAAPSEQAFAERYTTENAWSAYRFVEPTSEEQWSQLQEECPQFGS